VGAAPKDDETEREESSDEQQQNDAVKKPSPTDLANAGANMMLNNAINNQAAQSPNKNLGLQNPGYNM